MSFITQNSLADLIGKMKKSSPHFVRCIKPNTAKLPDKFTPEYVIAQLRYTGVMETTRIRRQGYPMRLTPDEFLERSVSRHQMQNSSKSVKKCKKC